MSIKYAMQYAKALKKVKADTLNTDFKAFSEEDIMQYANENNFDYLTVIEVLDSLDLTQVKVIFNI